MECIQLVESASNFAPSCKQKVNHLTTEIYARYNNHGLIIQMCRRAAKQQSTACKYNFHWFVVIILNTKRPRQNVQHIPYEIIKWIFMNENVSIAMMISLSEPMMGSLLTHICVARFQRVNRRCSPNVVALLINRCLFSHCGVTYNMPAKRI